MPDRSAAPDGRLSVYELARQLCAGLLEERPDLLPIASRILREVDPCRHSKDFSSVVWHGEHYTFSGAQSKVVQLLWRASKHGARDVRQETLLDAAGSDSDSIRDLFKAHSAWNVMIIPGPTKGTYRLAPPNPA